jgi:hypothetical protein
MKTNTQSKTYWYKVTFYSGHYNFSQPHLYKRIESRYVEVRKYDPFTIIDLASKKDILIYYQGNLPKQRIEKLINVSSLKKYYEGRDIYSCRVRSGCIGEITISVEIEPYEI